MLINQNNHIIINDQIQDLIQNHITWSKRDQHFQHHQKIKKKKIKSYLISNKSNKSEYKPKTKTKKTKKQKQKREASNLLMCVCVFFFF